MPTLADLTYTVYRSARRRRTVALLVQPEGEVRVMAPARMSLRMIEWFVQEKAGWIQRRLAKLRQNPPKKRAQEFADGAEAYYLGKVYKIWITQNAGQPGGCQPVENELVINVSDTNLSAAALREEARVELTLWYKKQARRDFQERLTIWSERLGVKPGRLIVTSPERRWGSCNTKGEIRINYRLILASPDLIDYVMTHELCHIRHKNHGRSFWRFLESTMPDYKDRRRRLRLWEKAEN